MPRLAFEAQKEGLKRYRATHLLPEGLFGIEMDMENDIYEMELNGIAVDMERVKELTKIYNDKRNDMESQFLTMVMARGFGSDFNHRSVVQIRELLFGIPSGENGSKGGLGLVPIVTTKPKGGQQKKWEWVMRQPPDIQKHYSASTNQQTLEILEEQHPMVYHLLNLRRVDTVCKNFFRDDDEGGIAGNIWSDGKLHTHLSQLTNTGRLKSSKPNAQNFSKQSERFLLEIFGKDKVPHPMRSIAVADPGCVYIEGDIKQAELFALAGLSGDPNLLRDLTTPGKDVHTSTTVESFYMTRLMPDGITPVDDQFVLDLARRNLKEFEALEKTFLYRTAREEIITHDQFKSGIRTGGKALSFGENFGCNF